MRIDSRRKARRTLMRRLLLQMWNSCRLHELPVAFVIAFTVDGNHKTTISMDFPHRSDTTVNESPPSTRRRMPFWIGIAALILLFPAIVIPLLVRSSGELPFTNLDQLDVKAVRSIDLLVIERPDGGPNIGMPHQLFPVPPTEFEAILSPLRKAEPVAAESPRGIWLGRMVVTLDDGRAQSVMFHRPKSTEDSRTARLEIRIGRNQYMGPPVRDFIAHAAKIAGLPADEKK